MNVLARGNQACLEKSWQIDFSVRIHMAMEFAKTAAAGIAAADDSWLPEGTRSFLLAGASAAGRE